ncbi:Uncharacterised protein [Bacteroides faecis]|uniref:Uncharacterized protein n=1 Tax=Bacteroides faecis TaxID=674529 RepID=A0A6N2V2E3_9BACE
MAEINCYEHQLFDARWIKGSNFSYNNTHTNKYYAKSVYDDNIIKNHIAAVHYGS